MIVVKNNNRRPERGTVGEALTTARRRRTPRFVIVNASGCIVLTSCGPEHPDLNIFSPLMIAQIIAEIRAGDGEVFILTTPTTALRAIPLVGSLEPSYAIFIEPVESRDLLADAGVSYGLTLREIDVLRLILHGMGTTEIAGNLSIAVTTVHAHVKNIARKTKSTKRTEILAKLLGVR